MSEMTQQEMNDVYRMIRENQDLMPVIFTEEQPSDVAMRLIRALPWKEGITTDEVVEFAHALDAAGVGEAVESLAQITDVAKSRENRTVRLVAMKSLAHRALAALRGDQS